MRFTVYPDEPFCHTVGCDIDDLALAHIDGGVVEVASRAGNRAKLHAWSRTIAVSFNWRPDRNSSMSSGSQSLKFGHSECDHLGGMIVSTGALPA